MSDPQPKSIQKGTYRHTKTGNLYEVIGVALHSETSEQLVVYRPLYSTKYELFARPYDIFTEAVELKGETRPRFEYVGETGVQ